MLPESRLIPPASGRIGYGRLSQEDERHHQDTTLEERIELRKGILVHIARDLGGFALEPNEIIFDVMTGASLLERPDFLTILEWCATKQIHTLVIADITRATRDVGDWKRIERALFAGEILLLTGRGKFFFDRYFDPTMLQMMAVFGESERRQFSFRAKAANDQRARKGQHSQGRAPYGYKWNKEHRIYEIIPAEYLIVEEIFRRITTEGSWKIAADLQARGIPPPGRSGRALDYWTATTVRAITRNPHFAGFPAKRRERDRDGKVADLPPERWVWAEQEQDYPHPITLEQWHDIQEAIVARRKSEAGRTGLLTGLLRCAEGSRMTFSGKLYACKCFYSYKKHRGTQLRAEVLERTVITAVLDGWSRLSPARINRVTAPQKADSTSETRLLTLRRAEREKTRELEKLQTDADFLDTLPGYGREKRIQRMTELSSEIARLQTEIESLKAKQEAEPLRLPAETLALIEAAGGLKTFFETAPPLLRRELLRAFVTAITLDPVPDGRRNTPSLQLTLRAPLGTGHPQTVPLIYSRYQPRQKKSADS